VEVGAEIEAAGWACRGAVLVASGSDFFGADSADFAVGSVVNAGSSVSGFKTRRFPVCRSVCTGSASAINCSIFFKGVGKGMVVAVGVILREATVVASLAGGRRTTPCIAGRVRVFVVSISVLSGAVVGALDGSSPAGTGWIAGGLRSAMAGFALSGVGLKGGGSSGSGADFLALKKM